MPGLRPINPTRIGLLVMRCSCFIDWFGRTACILGRAASEITEGQDLLDQLRGSAIFSGLVMDEGRAQHAQKQRGCGNRLSGYAVGLGAREKLARYCYK